MTQDFLLEANKKLTGTWRAVALNRMERAPDEYQARTVYQDYVKKLKKAMLTDEKFFQFAPPFMAIRHGDNPDGYWIFDGNHNMKAMRELYKETKKDRYLTHDIVLYEGLTPEECIALGARQNKKIEGIQLNTEWDITSALRKMCQLRNPEKDPPGGFTHLTQYHYLILGKEKTEYIAKKGKKSSTDGGFHEKWLAKNCTNEAFKALKSLYKKDPDLKMNQKYRAMCKFDSMTIEKLLVWVNKQKKVKLSTWRGINAMCTKITQKNITAEQMTHTFLDALYLGENEKLEIGAEVCLTLALTILLAFAFLYFVLTTVVQMDVL
jgi:hypothetical protein